MYMYMYVYIYIYMYIYIYIHKQLHRLPVSVHVFEGMDREEVLFAILCGTYSQYLS